MPREPKSNIEARIQGIVDQLKTVLIQREQGRLEQKVDEQIARIIEPLEAGKTFLSISREGPRWAMRSTSHARGRVRRAPAASSNGDVRGRYERTPAQRKAQAAKMRAYWANKRREKAKA